MSHINTFSESNDNLYNSFNFTTIPSYHASADPLSSSFLNSPSPSPSSCESYPSPSNQRCSSSNIELVLSFSKQPVLLEFQHRISPLDQSSIEHNHSSRCEGPVDLPGNREERCSFKTS
jgi:hypothetical protein